MDEVKKKIRSRSSRRGTRSIKKTFHSLARHINESSALFFSDKQGFHVMKIEFDPSSSKETKANVIYQMKGLSMVH